MNMTAIREKAKILGVKAGRCKKADLIRTIQKVEGNFPCFATARDYCDQKLCSWRTACLPKPKKKTIRLPWQKKQLTYTEKFVAGLGDLKIKVAELDKKAREMAGKGKKDAQAEIKQLEKKLAECKSTSQKMAANSEGAWKEAKKGFDAAWKDLTKAYNKAAKKLNK
ncbi:MAG: hypothetical protein ABFR97_07970 [Thermodesulfobacteriota bacterium]